MQSFVRCVRVCVCVCVCVRERERQGHITVESAVLIAGLCLNTFEHHHCVCHVTLFHSRLELMLKLTTLLTVFIFTLKAETRDYSKGRYISDVACGCSANHNAPCQLANQSRLCVSEGGAL